MLMFFEVWIFMLLIMLVIRLILFKVFRVLILLNNLFLMLNFLGSFSGNFSFVELIVNVLLFKVLLVVRF